MNYSLGISSKKIMSIVFLLITIAIALILSGIPMLVSTHEASLPLSEKKENFQPMAVVVQDVLPTIPIVSKPVIFKDNSKVFEHLIGVNSPNEKFNLIREF